MQSRIIDLVLFYPLFLAALLILHHVKKKEAGQQTLVLMGVSP